MPSPLDKAITRNEKRLQSSLVVVERRILSLMGKLKTDSTGAIMTTDLNLAAAMNMRQKIYEQLSPYLSAAKASTDEFTETAKYVKARLKSGGFDIQFVEADTGIIEAYQQDTFQSLASIGQQYSSDIGNSIYTAAIAGTPFDELAADISQMLVGGVTSNGQPLSAYAKTYAHTGLMELDSTLFRKKATEAGVKNFTYFGSTVQDTRKWCVEHHGKSFSQDEIKAWSNQKWQGKKAGDPFIVRGGWNCRHHWIAAIESTATKPTKETKPAPKVKAKPKAKAKAKPKAPAKVKYTPASMKKAGQTLRHNLQKEMGLAPDDPLTSDNREAFIAALFKHLKKGRSFDNVQANIVGSGKAAPMVRKASTMFPDAWVSKSNQVGDTHTRYSQARGSHFFIEDKYDGLRGRIKGGFGVNDLNAGDSYIVAGRMSTAVHEYTHRLQSVFPHIDDVFAAEHASRTNGDPLKRLRDLTGNNKYKIKEVAREDHYVTAYQGREYGKGEAREVMTIAFEYLLGGDRVNFEAFYMIDREMFDMTLGILEHV